MRLTMRPAEATHRSARRPGNAAPSDGVRRRRSGAVDRMHARRHRSRSGAGPSVRDSRTRRAGPSRRVLPFVVYCRARAVGLHVCLSHLHPIRRSGSPDHAIASPELPGCRFRPLPAPYWVEDADTMHDDGMRSRRVAGDRAGDWSHADWGRTRAVRDRGDRRISGFRWA